MKSKLITVRPVNWGRPLGEFMDNLVDMRFTIRKSIAVLDLNHDKDITVQVFEDGILTHCTHAGAELEGVDVSYDYNGMEQEHTQIMHCCDKCNAVSIDGVDWSE